MSDAPIVSFSNVVNLEKVFATKTIVEQICIWNGRRYKQEFNEELTLNLIHEEVGEIIEAQQQENFLKVLDGFADVFYVSIGAMWKLGLSPSEITKHLDHLQKSEEIWPLPAHLIDLTLGNVTRDTLGKIALSCTLELTDILRSEDYAIDVIRAICNSNDTKRVEKVASDIKANKDKGSSYIPPDEDLAVIVYKAFATDDTKGEKSGNQN